MRSTDTAVHVSAAGAGSWLSAEIFRFRRMGYGAMQLAGSGVYGHLRIGLW